MSPKIGVIFCGYGTLDLLPRSLDPWVLLRAERGNVLIAGVSVQFAGFSGHDDGTRERLRGYLDRGDIDYLVDWPDGMRETEARGRALTWLKEQGCDLYWLVDSDELYTPDQITRIIDIVNENPWVDWFRVSLKNYVLDERTYLAEPFTPPRIFRNTPNRYSNLRPTIFTADNDIGYQDKNEPNGTIWPQTALVSQTIPAGWAWVPHITWQSGPRARDKVAYQAARWGAQTCSFAWDEVNDTLIFNPALPQPKVIRE